MLENSECCVCNLDYSQQPFDYQIKPNHYGALFASRDPRQFSLFISNKEFFFFQEINKIEGTNYHVECNKRKSGNDNNENINSSSFSSSSSNNSRTSHHISAKNKKKYENEEEKENCELLRRLFLGKKISVNHDNYQFLHEAADSIGLPELFEMTERFYYIKKSPKSLIVHVLKSLFNFVCKLSLFNRLLVSFWDLAGPTMVMCLFINIVILFVTMALMTLKDYLVAFFFVVIPFLLYALFFPNLICISVCEALERNIFKKKTFFYSHQKLVSKMIRILMNFDNFPQYFNLGKWHDFIHGILVLVFFLGFLANTMNTLATRFLNVWLQIFVFFIPVIRYSLLFLLYLVHAVISLFEKPRQRYRELRDFDDPFLASFYMQRLPWKSFFISKNKKNVKLILRMIFSKTAYSFLAAIAIFIYMGCAETKMSAGQICITIFIFILIFLPLATRISFPFFWIRRIRDVPVTEAKLDQLKEEAIARAINGRNMDGESNAACDDDENDCPIELLNWKILDETWGKSYSHLRWSSLILVSLTVLFIVILIPMCATVAVDTSKSSDGLDKANNFNSKYLLGNFKDDESRDNTYNFKSYEYVTKTNKNLALFEENSIFRKATSPACFMRPKGLSIMQIIALSLMAHVSSPDDSTYNIMVKEFFSGFQLEFIDTGFYHDKSFLSQMIHIRFADPKLSVFSIRGTVNNQDIIADAEIWFSSVMINLVIPFIPFVELYSDRSIELIGVVTNLPRYAFKQFSLVEEYVTRFATYINDYTANHLQEGEDILITGHSLGGGLAKILALKTGFQAVAVSGPGVRMIDEIYKNESVRNVRNSIIDVIPGEDLIARVDLPVGTQVNVPCRRGLTCHDAKRTICQIAAMCGSMDTHSGYCSKHFDEDTIQEMINQGNPVKVI